MQNFTRDPTNKEWATATFIHGHNDIDMILRRVVSIAMRNPILKGHIEDGQELVVKKPSKPKQQWNSYDNGSGWKDYNAKSYNNNTYNSGSKIDKPAKGAGKGDKSSKGAGKGGKGSDKKESAEKKSDEKKSDEMKPVDKKA